MNSNGSVEGPAHNTQLCWVHTKWGRHQAKVLMETDMKAEEIARKSIKVASDICVFTNNNITMEKV